MRIFLSLMAICLLYSCSKQTPLEANGEVNSKAAISTPEPYLFTGDLSGIIERGQIRIIAPRFDGADALPREGLSVFIYQNLAAEFAKSLKLPVVWVYVDGFDALIPALTEGRGDVIVTNMTVTKARASRVSFTKAIAQVSEVLIAKKTSSIANIDDLKEIKLAIPKGTAYIDTLNSEGLSASIQVVDGATSTSDLLSAISEGLYAATILDSDMARDMLAEYPDLSTKFRINKHRPIAWAVRETSPQLLSTLNEFLVSHHVKESATLFETRNWSQIKASGRIRMLTANNPASYFMWRGELMGFDYELMKAFADTHNLHLAVVVKNSIAELFDALKKGEGDVIAASLTRSEERESNGVAFSRPYLKVTEQLVGRKAGPVVESLEGLNGYSVGLNPQTVFYQGLKSRLAKGHNVKIIAVEGATTEELLAQMVKGDFDFTIADSHLVALEKTYHQNVDVSLNLSESSEISWGLREGQGALANELNAFIKKEYRGLFYNIVFNKYFKNARKIKRYQQERVFADGKLSPYDDLVKELANQYNMDWRLLIAQMYQESKFDPKAKSFAGALGLMQVMPRTAKELGFANLYEPKNSLGAGITYMNWLEARFPGELDFQERIFFTLAAYNAGTGHVRDARKLAKTLGYDSNKWFGNVEQAMLKLSKPEYYKKARFGYVRGREPVEYVRKIHDRYLAYIQAN